MKSKTLVFAALVIAAAFMLSATTQQSAEQLYQSAIYKEDVEGKLEEAIAIYRDIVKRFPGERAVAAKAQLHIGLCYEKLGLTEAEKAFQKVISDFPERVEEVKTAKHKLSLIAKTRSTVDTGERGPEIRQIWSGPGASDVGKPSLDGKFLSFVDRETGNLAVKDLESGRTRLLTTKGPLEKEFQFAGNSCWSPDGNRLAYSWFSQTNVMELRIIDADGSNMQTLHQKENEFAFPSAWSPDGKSLAVSLLQDYYTSYSVSVISVDDGSLRILKKVKDLKQWPRNMVFSRDGRFIFVDLPQEEGGSKHDIFAFSVGGQEETRVVEHPADDGLLDLVPGTDRLLFSSDRTGKVDAWLVETVNARPRGEPILVRRNLGPIVPLGMSRAGDLFYRINTAMQDIFIASVDLEKGTLIAPPQALSQALVGVNYDPQWSPDGKYLAFLSDLKEGPEGRTTHALRIRSSETGETREIFAGLEWLDRPHWAPDGRSVFVVGSDGKTFLALYRIDVQTGEATFYIDSEPGANIKFIAPSPDGKSVYYTYFEFSKRRCSIMCIDLATKETRELYQDVAPPDIGDLHISPDGRSLAFRVAEPGWPFVVKILDLPGGSPRDLVRSKIKVAGKYIWAPDGKSVIFFKDVSEGKGQKSELWAAPIEGGEPHSLGLTADATATVLSLHPDHRRIAFATRQPSSEIWVMENFLPKEK
jgi:Tol biopolymer transport system component